MKRYHPIIVTIHWFLAIMIIVALYIGLDIANLSNDVSSKISYLSNHIKLGFVILILMIIRLLVRLFSKKLNDVDDGVLGTVAQYLLYILVFAVVISGMVTSFIADIPAIIANNGYLSDSINALPSKVAHGILTKLLGATILIHFLASLYHQFIKKDKLYSKIWFGKRK